MYFYIVLFWFLFFQFHMFLVCFLFPISYVTFFFFFQFHMFFICILFPISYFFVYFLFPISYVFSYIFFSDFLCFLYVSQLLMFSHILILYSFKCNVYNMYYTYYYMWNGFFTITALWGQETAWVRVQCESGSGSETVWEPCIPLHLSCIVPHT